MKDRLTNCCLCGDQHVNCINNEDGGRTVITSSGARRETTLPIEDCDVRNGILAEARKSHTMPKFFRIIFPKMK